MNVLTSLLLWLHFIGLAMGLGGGIALGVVGPKLIAAPEHQADLYWSLEKTFGIIGSAGLGTLIVTGPLMVRLKFGGTGSFSGWFWAKIVFVALAVVGVGAHQWAGARFRRGDKSAIAMMFTAGRLAGGSMVLAALCAAFAFG